MKKLSVLLLLVYLFAGSFNKLSAQSILNPNDTIAEYDPENPPVEPPYGQIGTWVRTKSLSWNSDSYKCYIYEGSCFRLKFPKTYNPNANDGKKYPLAIVFHGGGEAGGIYDNETQLYHGGLPYGNAADNGTFDGYILFMQSQGYWGTTSYLRIIDIINYMIANNKMDPFVISVNGLSSGGQASWDMAISYPKYVSASLPMSNVSIGYKDAPTVNKLKFTPMWNFQGALDGSPSPSTAEQVADAMKNAGANYKYSEYADIGHNTWDSAFAEPDFFPFILRGYCSNPWVLYGRTGFCDSTNINLTVGVPPGFDGYQWRKNGALINGASGNSINVTTLGTYDARVLRGSIWSDWSRTPAVIHITPPTVAPPITVAGLMSNVLVAADGKTYVNLQVPDSGYTSYTWKKVGSDSVISNQRIYTATQPGQYIVAVTEQYGCSSIYSQPFSVIDAKGFNVPDAASKLTAAALSSTEIQLSWENNPHPVNNETFFEIYRSAGQDGNYAFAGKVPADVLTFKDSKLSAGTTYFYKVRAISNNGAAPLSNIVSANTKTDNTPPTAPMSVLVVYSTNSAIQIKWNPSIDNVGIKNYQVYMNGVKTYSTTDTSIIAGGLQKGSIYTFYVKAVDSSDNYSVQSNLASSPAILKGLLYNYYEGYFLTVPDFNNLAPVYSGVATNLSTIKYSRRQAQYGFLWQGFLNVPAAGNYRFALTSDDGSLLWFNPYDPSITPFINNDHTLDQQTKYGTINLSKGIIPITIAYFQLKAAAGVQLSWANPAVFGDSAYHAIADSFFAGGTLPSGIAPTAPAIVSATTQSYNKIKLKWNDNSNNETNFQVYRSIKSNGGYSVVYSSGANVTQYQDTGLVANVTYYYKINAVNTSGTSAFSATLSAKTSKLANPKPPTNITATVLSSSSIKLTWNDVDTAEINYQVFRSASDSFNFKPAVLLPANSTTFTDTDLYGNTFYYYKVKTVSATSISVDKPAVKAKTLNNNPSINAKFSQKSVPYGVQTLIAVTASDPDGDTLTFSGKNLPSFASIVSSGYNKANLVFNPSSSQQGNYSNLKIFAKDNAGGADSSVFSLTVNNNYYPVLDSIGNYTMNENDVLNITINSTDQNAGDNLNITISGAPVNYSLVPVSNGKAKLVLSPNYGASGSYQVQVTVSDGNGGTVSRQFSLYVNDKDPSQTIYVRFKDIDAIGSPWNNVTGVTTNNFKDATGKTTSAGLAMQTTWFATWHEGPNTGNNSGIYPDNVLKDYYYFGNFGGPNTVTSKITGLDTSRFYNISFFGASNWSGAQNNGTTIYTIGAQSISLAVQNNTKNTADFTSIKPAADGSISFTMSKGSNTPSGYINAIVIKSLFTDTLKPATPHYLVALNANNGVQLTWNDMAYNETGYKVFRATNQAGPYTIINSNLPFNTNSYLDTSTAGGTQYYYFVKATNATANSDSSNIATVITKDKVPVIAPIANVLIKNNQQQTVNVTANDDASDHVILTAVNLPSFVSFADNGNGTGSFSIVPNSGVTGTFENVTVKATDLSDSSSTASFNITITDQNINSVYINFSNGSLAPAPWNNFTSYPNANALISNLIDDNSATTSISLKLLTGFQGNFATGMQPGNNKGVYPEVVMRTGIYEGSASADSIQISGLATNKKYNFVFFNSHDDGLKGTTNFTINGQTVSLNATHNINTTAQINGILANAGGQVTIKIVKASGSDYAYLNSLVIQSYDSAQKLLAPSDLRIVNTTRTSVKLQWADKSFDETGFEIWRASDTTNPSYALLATVGANAATYTDAGLSVGRTYYYTIRSIKTGAQSAYCNPVAATTYSQMVYVNFTFTAIAPAPWNNTQALPDPGLVWNNFIDDTRTPTGIGIKELGAFAGLYGPGMSTGNNSGIYPDNVLANSYGLFTGESSSIKLTGLNVNSLYNLTFIASSQAGGDVNTAYTINGKKVILNASLNIDGSVTMYGVAPDVNGEIVIGIAPNTLISQFGLIGGLIVQEYTPSSRTILSPPQSFNKTAITLGNNKAGSLQKASAINNKAAVYPNPFNSSFTLSLYLNKEDNVQVQLYNVSGKLVLQKNLGKVSQGAYNITPDKNITPGIYILKIIGAKTGYNEYIKVLKQ